MLRYGRTLLGSRAMILTSVIPLSGINLVTPIAVQAGNGDLT